MSIFYCDFWIFHISTLQQQINNCYWRIYEVLDAPSLCLRYVSHPSAIEVNCWLFELIRKSILDVYPSSRRGNSFCGQEKWNIYYFKRQQFWLIPDYFAMLRFLWCWRFTTGKLRCAALGSAWYGGITTHWYQWHFHENSFTPLYLPTLCFFIYRCSNYGYFYSVHKTCYWFILKNSPTSVLPLLAN